MRLALDERNGKTGAVALIESDIRELGNRVRAVRRTYAPRLV
jgi:hypothetical protein